MRPSTERTYGRSHSRERNNQSHGRDIYKRRMSRERGRNEYDSRNSSEPSERSHATQYDKKNANDSRRNLVARLTRNRSRSGSRRPRSRSPRRRSPSPRRRSHSRRRNRSPSPRKPQPPFERRGRYSPERRFKRSRSRSEDRGSRPALRTRNRDDRVPNRDHSYHRDNHNRRNDFDRRDSRPFQNQGDRNRIYNDRPPMRNVSNQRDFRFVKKDWYDPNVIPLNKRLKKLNNWDVRPVGLDGLPAIEPLRQAKVSLVPIKQFETAQSAGDRASLTAMMLNYLMVNAEPISSSVKNASKSLYIGNLPDSTTEKDVESFIFDNLKRFDCLVKKGDPVRKVRINQEKKHAIVRLRDPEETTNALALDGMCMKKSESQKLVIKRVKDYIPLPDLAIEPSPIKTTDNFRCHSNSPNKVTLSNIPDFITQEQLVKLVSLFGRLQAFYLGIDSQSNKFNGNCHFEYVDPSLTDPVVESLNDLELGFNRLKAYRSLKDCMLIDLSTLLPRLPTGLMGPLITSSKETNILQIINVITASDLENEEEYNDLLLDIREECSEFGRVESVIVPRPTDEFFVPGTGKAYVEFERTEDATDAAVSLAGRTFLGRTVITSFYPVHRFKSEDF